MNDELTGNRIGERLRKVAQLLFDGNKSDLARAMDMKPSSFGKYLRGTRRPGASVLERLTRMGVNVDWLLTGRPPILHERASSRQINASVLEDARSKHHSRSHRSMSAAESSSTDGQFYRIPTVKAQLRDGAVQFEEVGEPECISARAIWSNYGTSPDRLHSFVISSNRMTPTIRPGERVRGVLLDSMTSLEKISNGNIYLIHSTEDILVTRLYKRRTDETADNDHTGEQSQNSGSAAVSSRPFQNVDILMTGDHPEVSDESISIGKWTNDFGVIAELLEVRRSF